MVEETLCELSGIGILVHFIADQLVGSSGEEGSQGGQIHNPEYGRIEISLDTLGSFLEKCEDHALASVVSYTS